MRGRAASWLGLLSVGRSSDASETSRSSDASENPRNVSPSKGGGVGGAVRGSGREAFERAMNLSQGVSSSPSAAVDVTELFGTPVLAATIGLSATTGLHGTPVLACTPPVLPPGLPPSAAGLSETTGLTGLSAASELLALAHSGTDKGAEAGHAQGEGRGEGGGGEEQGETEEVASLRAQVQQLGQQ
ncbi:hypothetical protein T492DRAFT_851451, partial [Pavlovales sp. CCMP2436]